MLTIGRLLQKRFLLTVLVLVFFLALSLFMLRPLATHAGNSAVQDPFDPTFHAWTIAWDAHMLVENPLNLFNAKIFYPNRYTLAYSENEITNGVMAVPLMAATGNPMQSANYLLIFNFFLGAVGAYLLCYHLTRHRMASVVGGMAYGFAPFMFSHVTQLAVCSSGWIPLTFLFLHKYTEEKRPRDVILFAVFFVLQFLACTYLGLFLFVGILVFLLVRLIVARCRTIDLRWLVWLGVAAVLALVIIFPFARIYLKVNAENPGMHQNIGDVDFYSADVQDFMVAPEFNLLWGKLTKGLRVNTYTRGGPDTRSLFPGLIALVLGVLGAIYLFKRGKGESRFRFWCYLALVAAGVIFSLGTSLFIFGHRLSLPMPYDVLYRVIPGFRALRVPTRFMVLTTLALAVLSAFGAKWILEGVRARKGRNIMIVAFVVIAALLFVDTMTIAMPLVPVPTKNQFPRVYWWLKDQPGEAASIELPMPQDRNQLVEWESSRTYYSTLHWKRLINGYSSYVPHSWAVAQAECRDFPSDKSLTYLEHQRLQFVIVHGQLFGVALTRQITVKLGADPHFKLVRRFGSDYLYSVRSVRR